MTPSPDPLQERETIAPCPFCGSDEIMRFCDPTEAPDNSVPSRRLQCAGCHIEAPFYDTEAEAIAAWNTRSNPRPQAGREGWKLVPVEPTDGQMMAARGLIMSLSFGVPNSAVSLGEVARSGYYGEHWGHLLSDEEREIRTPLTKAHRAQLIYRAMLAASPTPPTVQALEAANVALRWVYEHGVQTSFSRPQEVSDAFNDAFHGAAQAQITAESRRSKPTVQDQAGEVERLRAALERIKTECAMSREQFVMQGPAFACRAVEHAVSIARAALTPKGKEEGT